ELVPRALGAILELLPDNVVAELDALVANEYGRSGDELSDFVLALPAERAVKQLAVVVTAAGIIAHLGSSSCVARRTAGTGRLVLIACAGPGRQRRTPRSGAALP